MEVRPGEEIRQHAVRIAEKFDLYVFQRTPSTVGVRGQRPLTAADVGADRPGWATERRENFLRLVSGEAVPGVDEDLVDDAWTESAALLEKLLPSFRRDGAGQGNEEFEAAYEALDHATMERIRTRVTEIVEDPATASALQPWYRYACKRPTFSDRYLPAFNRDNVTLVDIADSHGIERMTERGVVVDGVEYEVDALVFATGFSVGVSGITSGRLPVTGRDGVQLLHAWAQEGPRSLHGFASSGFPNLLKMGSLHNASSVNFSHILDEQAVHAAALVVAAETRGALVEPSREAEDAWAAGRRRCASACLVPRRVHAGLLQRRGRRPARRPHRLPRLRRRLPRGAPRLARDLHRRSAHRAPDVKRPGDAIRTRPRASLSRSDAGQRLIM